MARMYKRRRLIRGRARPYRRKTGRNFGRVRRIEKAVKRINSKIETKFVDWTVATLDATAPSAAMTPSVSTPATSNTMLINALGQGGAVQQRIGNAMRCTSVTWNIHVDGTSGGTENQNLVRVMIIRVKQWNRATVLDMTRVLSIGTTGSAYYPVQGLYAYNARNDYRILYDKQFNLYSYANAGGATPYCANIRGTLKLGFKTQYFGTTGNASDLDDNALFFCVFSDSVAAPHPTFYGAIRLKYRDQ